MKLTKKKVFTLALAVCLIAILSMSSLAWFTDDDSVTNDFNIAGSEDNDPDDVFSVNVWEKDEDGKIYDDEGITYPAILPGDELTKEVHIENTGSYHQYIRATVTVTGARLWQELYGQHVVPLDVLTNADLSRVHTLVAYFDAAQDAFVYELYYTDILPVDGQIVVFDTVNIHEGLDRYQAAALQNFQITVTADAVQTENVGDNVYEAFETVGLVKDVPITNATDLAAALAADGEARIVLDPNVAWDITVDYPVSDKTIDFGGAEGVINFAAGSSASNVVVTGINDKDGDGYSVITDKTFTGDLTIENSVLMDKVGKGAVNPNAGDITIRDCVFEGTYDEKTYGVRANGRTGNLTIENCTFNQFKSWAININGTQDGNLTVDNCTFNTRDGVLKTLGGGVTGDFTFTNNTLIGVLGHDGTAENPKYNQIIVSGSGNGPIIVAGTKTVANNKYIGIVDGEPVENEFISTPIVGDSEGEAYEGDLFAPGMTDFLICQNDILSGGATITVERTYDTVVLEDVIANVNGTLITAKADNTVILHNCNITLPAGAKLIVGDGVTIGQVMMHNVTVNGELLTQATAAQYLENVNWYQVW